MYKFQFVVYICRSPALQLFHKSWILYIFMVYTHHNNSVYTKVQCIQEYYFLKIIIQIKFCRCKDGHNISPLLCSLIKIFMVVFFLDEILSLWGVFSIYTYYVLINLKCSPMPNYCLVLLLFAFINSQWDWRFKFNYI
jgi:hypothetical protein